MAQLVAYTAASMLQTGEHKILGDQSKELENSTDIHFSKVSVAGPFD